MPLKRALLASAATPILALSLTTSPSLANSATAHTPTFTSGSMLIAQADQPPEEDIRKRPRDREGQKPQGERPQGGQAQPQGGKAKAPQQAEQPKRQQEQAQPERQQQAQPKKQREEAEPRKQRQQAQPERQREEAKPERRQEREAKPEPRKNAEPEQKPAAAERQKPKAEPSERKAAEPKSKEAPKREENAGKPERDNGKNAAKPQPKSEEAAKPQPKEGEKPQPKQAQPAGKQAPTPAERNANAPAGAEKPAGNAERKMKPAEKPSDKAEQPQPGGKAGEARQAQPADRNQKPGKKVEPAQAKGETAPAPKLAPVKSLNDKPAKKAVEPASADAKPQMLDVPNGAPVLDSAKDRDNRRGRDRDRARDRDRDRDQRREQRAEERRDDRRQQQRQPVEIRSVTEIQGERIQERPRYRPPENVTIEKEVHNRYIVNVDNRTYIENNDYDRISHRAEDVYYERLPDDNTRQVVVRPNGVQVVTIRNQYGDILQRSRIRDGQETVLIYAPDYDRDHRDVFFQPVDLPPIRLTEPVNEYILDAGDAAPDQYVTFLEKPPIEPVEQVYTLDQVRYSARLRDIMPRIDLDTITFTTGSAVIEQSQAQSLEALANAINDILQDDPGQVFMVEGHTDAVGSDQSNLVLSDQRAESVAAALTQDFDVPPENLVTQGYGEQYLKIETEEAARENRRVAIRRITPLIRPTAQN